MLPAANGGLELLRPVAWGSTQQHHVDVGGNDLPVGVEADEAPFRIDVDALTHRVHQLHQGLSREFGCSLRAGVHQKLWITQPGQGLLEFVLEYVSHADEFHARVSRKQVDCCLRAASAAADQAGAQALLSRATHQVGPDDGKRRRRSSYQRSAEE